MGALGITRQQITMVCVLLSGALLVVLSQTLLSPALPTIMAHLNVDEMTVQWLTSAYALTEAVVIPMAAWFMGRFRTRTLFVSYMTLFTCGSVVAAISPSFSILLLGRVMQAMAAGVMMVMVMSLILLTFPREKRGQAMGIVNLIIGFAPAVGPSIGGLLVDVIGWRMLFAALAVLAAIVVLLALKLLQNEDRFPRTRFDAFSVVFSSIGLASLLYGLGTLTSAANLALPIGLMVFGIICIGIFAWRQFQLEEPMLRLQVFKSRRYRTAVVCCMLLQAALIGLSVLLPLYIQNTLGHSATVSGLVILPGALLGAFMGLIAGRAFDRMGVRIVTVVGATAALLGGIGMFFYGMDSSLAFVIGVNIVFSLSVQSLMTPINTWGVNSLSNDLVQHATSVTNTMNQVGASLGTALIISFTAVGSANATGSAAQATYAGYHCSFIVALVLLATAFVLVTLFVRNRPGEGIVAASGDNVEQPTEEQLEAHRLDAIDISDLANRPNAVVDVMDRNPLAIPAQATLSEATTLLAEAGASGAPLVREDDTMVGFLSNSDILHFFGDEEALAVGAGSGFVALRSPDDEAVQERLSRLGEIQALEVATKRVTSVTPETSFEQVCSMLAERRYKEVPVVQDGKLLGVVRRRDLMLLISALMKAHPHQAEEGADA